MQSKLEASLGYTRHLSQEEKKKNLGIVAHTSNPSIREAKERGLLQV